MVNEAGASVYSASEVARQEFPDLDVTQRGTISIGRRLQDPLAELVKIDPKAIGVGLYQHDVDQKALATALDRVVVSCVNFAGVDVNVASAQLLRYVSGVSSRIAEQYRGYRAANGPFTHAQQLLKVAGLGPATFVQAAGFLKIAGRQGAAGQHLHPSGELRRGARRAGAAARRRRRAMCRDRVRAWRLLMSMNSRGDAGGHRGAGAGA